MRRTSQPREYRVKWEIDVQATSSLQAARQARQLMVGAFTTAKVVDAWPTDSPSRARRIDLCQEESERLEPADILAKVLEAFPGLTDDAIDVNGGDLVEFLTARIAEVTPLQD